MSVYSDFDLLESLDVLFAGTVPARENVQPASIDLTMGPNVIRFESAAWHEYDLSNAESGRLLYSKPVDIGDEPVRLLPGACLLVATWEYVTMPQDLRGVVFNKSSLARAGLSVSNDAGYIDPGFKGNITLMLANHAPHMLILRAGMRICQIEFAELRTACAAAYGSASRKSRYQDSRSVVAARSSEA